MGLGIPVGSGAGNGQTAMLTVVCDEWTYARIMTLKRPDKDETFMIEGSLDASDSEMIEKAKERYCQILRVETAVPLTGTTIAVPVPEVNP